MPHGATQLLWFSITVTLIGSGLYGYTLGVLNTSLTALCSDLGIVEEIHGALVVSAVLGGGVMGSFLAEVAANAVGPKKSLAFNNAVFCCGSFLSALSPRGFVGLLLGRFVTGISAGALTLFTPRYIAEISPSNIRGALGSVSQLAICLGILVSSLVGWPYNGSKDITWANLEWWRIMLLLPIPASILQGVLLGLCPESPVWLRWSGQHVSASHVEKTLSSAALVHEPVDSGNSSGNSNSSGGAEAAPRHFAEGLLQDETVTSIAREHATWAEVFDRRHHSLLILTLGVVLAQQLSGINTVIFYSSSVFVQAGLTNPIVGACVVNLVNVVGTIFSTAVTDHYGRKPLMIISHAGMGAALFTITALSGLPVLLVGTAATCQLTCILVFVLSFSFGAGPIPFVYLAEVLAASSALKGKWAAWCTASNWMTNLAVGLTFPFMLSNLGIGGAYMVYAAFNFCCCAFCAIRMVETKKQSLGYIREQLVRVSTGRD